MIIEPMLANKSSKLEDIEGEQYVQPKYDGIRCFTRGGKALSRKCKPIPNDYIRKEIESLGINGLDGEIVIKSTDFSGVQSGVMSKDGEPDFEFHVFDYYKPFSNFEKRIKSLIAEVFTDNKNFWLKLAPTVLTSSKEQRQEYLARFLSEGYEGMMVRSPSALYKFGRATKKEGYLNAIKMFTDSEAQIIGFVEQMKNTNELDVDELGRAKRSSRKDGMVPYGTMGTIVVVDVKTKVQFEIGTGFTKELRKEIWDNKDKYLGKIVTYQFQEHGTKNKPRIPSFKGFRHEDDIS